MDKKSSSEPPFRRFIIELLAECNKSRSQNPEVRSQKNRKSKVVSALYSDFWILTPDSCFWKLDGELPGFGQLFPIRHAAGTENLGLSTYRCLLLVNTIGQNAHEVGQKREMKIEPLQEGVPFEVNLFYERLIKLRRTNRKSFDSLSPATHLALGAYERAKRQAVEIEVRGEGLAEKYRPRPQCPSDKAGKEAYISESEYRELLEMLFPEDGDVYAVLIAHIDESQTGEKVPVVAVGGGVGTGKQWSHLLEAWRKALDTEHVEIFHTSEFETPEGRRGTIYDGWDKPRLDKFHNLLLDAIKENQLEVSMAATIAISEFEKVKPAQRLTRGKYGDAFYFCAFMLIEQIAIWTRKTFGGDHRVTYWFEQGGLHQKRLVRAYAAIAEDDRVKRYYRMWLAPTFAPKDSQPGLQVADKLVYEAAKHASHYFDPDPPEQRSKYRREERRRIWHDRYPTQELILSGLDIHSRWYDANELADFYKRQGIKFTVEKRKDFISNLVSKAKRKARREAKR